MTTTPKRVRKSVVYKRAHFHTEVEGQTLKSLLSKALAKHATFGQRKLNVSDPENPIYHALCDPRDEATGFVFGALMTFTPGTDPLFLVDDEKAADVTIEKLKAPDTEDGKRREVLESMMYFGVIKNHLVLMQSQALKGPQIEAYLQWFLHDTQVLAGDNTFQLVDSPSKAVRDKISRSGGVRAITLGGEVTPRAVVATDIGESSPPATPAQPMTRSQSVTAIGVAGEGDWGVLAALKKLMSPSQAAKIDFDQLTGSNIEMSVTLRYKRETTDDGQKLMDTLGVAFRNTEDVEAAVQLVNGGSIKGAELKLNGHVSLTAYDGQFSASEVFEGIRLWLLSKVSSEDLSAG